MDKKHYLLFFFAIAASLAFSEENTAAPGKSQDQRQKMLNISWTCGPDLPTGFQDSDGGIIDHWLISVCGFCCGHSDVPGKADKFPRKFMKEVYAIDLDDTGSGWQILPEFPGEARQELFAIAVDDRLYCWGGFSYTKPFCYKDGYRLSRKNKQWQWEILPDLPWPVCSSGICALGSKIYIVGGADYDETAFYTQGNREGKIERLGSRLLEYDTTNPQNGWKELTPCPGTPRWVAAAASVNGKIYVIGGASGNDNPSKETCTIVDNWRYDPSIDRWERIPDLPVSSGNFPAGRIVYRDRFIALIGGYQYPHILNPDGSTRAAYGQAYARHKDRPYYSDVFIYDTETDCFGTADPLPLNNNLPMTVITGNHIHLLGGETGGASLEGKHYPKHPDLYLVGKIEE